MMKHMVREQYQAKLDLLLNLPKVSRPKEGWIRVLRKALGMSSPQLARRLGISKSQASQMERMEVEDRITLKQLRRVADEFHCELVYALVPRHSVATMIREQAQKKAKRLVEKVTAQMALEAQQLPAEKQRREVEREIERLLHELPRELWDEE